MVCAGCWVVYMYMRGRYACIEGRTYLWEESEGEGGGGAGVEGRPGWTGWSWSWSWSWAAYRSWLLTQMHLRRTARGVHHWEDREHRMPCKGCFDLCGTPRGSFRGHRATGTHTLSLSHTLTLTHTHTQHTGFCTCEDTHTHRPSSRRPESPCQARLEY